MQRRTFMLGSVAALLLPSFAHASNPKSDLGKVSDAIFLQQLQALQQSLGGRLGVSVQDVQGKRTLAFQAEQRFPMCSSFKWLLAAAILRRVDEGKLSLQKRIHYGKEELLPWSPITEQHVADGMTIGGLCEATVTTSDNPAANLLLRQLGGPSMWTEFVRGLGDKVTRLDRWEPELNSAIVNDERDTTTSAAMVADLQRLLLADALKPASRAQLLRWMRATETSGQRLRHQLPKGWTLADKTGTGDNGTAADVGLYVSPQGKPLLVAVYLTQAKQSREQQEAVIARVGELARAWL
ncbi:class A beta-lactamase [Leeia sp.]|uniref:class A beta-lactamase n=1 Tax=Leeia sp. TaxID=2884678 RepID=UPI0035B04DB1